MKISLGTLKDSGDELATFLEPRMGAKPNLSGGALEFDDDALRKGVKPRHAKTYVKRFLYMKEVRSKYRVFVSGKELTIQEVEVPGKEEEASKEEEVKKEEPAEEAPKAEEPKEEKKPKSAKKPRAKKKAES